MPDFKIERQCQGLVCGIDEAGRGPLAGPVVAAAVILDPRRFPKMLRDGLDDSKVLTREQREACYRALRRCADRGAARIGVGAASTIEIDRLNILRAALLAMARAVAGARSAAGHSAGRRRYCSAARMCGADRGQRRRAQLLDRRRVRRRQGHARSDHARAGPPLPRLWLGDQCRIRDARAWRGNPPAGHHPPSSTLIRTGAARRRG